MVDADVIHHGHIRFAVDGRMDERSCPTPVLIRRVRVEDLGEKLRVHAIEKPLAQTRFRIGLSHVRKREDVGGMKEIDIGVGVTRCLREAMIEAATPPARNVGQHAVENAPVSLVFVETMVQKRSEEAPGL